MSGSGSDRRVLVAALILGAIAAGLAVAFLASAGGNSEPAPIVSAATRPVVVAAVEIPIGTIVTESMLEIRDLPLSAVVDDTAEEFDQVVGFTARYPINSGEQISRLRLVEPPKVQALSFQIPDGLRAFTIPVNSNSSPAALLAPGDFVDILLVGPIDKLVTSQSTYTTRTTLVSAPVKLTLADDEEAPIGVTTLLQNIQVLSVQRTYVADGLVYNDATRGTPPEEGGISNVTLGITPGQAELLWLANQSGSLTLTLRAFGDDTIVTPGRVSTVGGQQ